MGRYTYWCESAYPIEEAVDRFVINEYSLNLQTSNSCHFFCKNEKCDNKKNIVKLQEEYFKQIKCKSCNTYTIEWGFFLIIYKLKVKGLLPKNFACVCCGCYKKIGEEGWEKILQK